MVIAILGVLVNLVVSSLLDNKKRANRQRAVSDTVTLEDALDMYRLGNERYPATEQGPETLIQQPANVANIRNYRTDGYIKRLSKDPRDNDYWYFDPGERGLSDVYILGAGG